MKEKKILYVSSEVVPYLPENEISSMSFEIPKMINKQGGQIRIFMPRYGNINERRHQLHEVIRLSGINLVIDDLDMPLIIKVASIPKERIQVYFIDNEDYFKRKSTFADENGKLHDDNDERAIFFAKGVIETVRKLNWSPDIIHVHGWMASLFPLYLKTYYKDEPVFENSKIVTSVYDKSFDESLNKKLVDKILFDEINEELIKGLKDPSAHAHEARRPRRHRAPRLHAADGLPRRRATPRHAGDRARQQALPQRHDLRAAPHRAGARLDAQKHGIPRVMRRNRPL